jgi:glycosyltransferase involved in cell wall biosynthesis
MHVEINKRYGVTALVPTIDETSSLGQTITTLFETCGADLAEVLVVVCDRTTEATLGEARKFVDLYPDRVRILRQKRKYVGGAYQDAFEATESTHVVMLSADLETDPNDVQRLIALSKSSPSAIIATSRWLDAGGFAGYSRIKLWCNWLFQAVFRRLYRTHLTDMTYGFRLYPTSVVRTIRWEELRHPFFLETILKPLRLGVDVIELPTKWRVRVEGESNNSFFQTFAYLPIAIRTCFVPAGSFQVNEDNAE